MIEIVPDEMGGFEAYGIRYEVCPATDVVMRFVEPRFDYLHYLDPKEQAITFHWLGEKALSALVEFGIPESRKRQKMPQCIYDQWLEWESNMDMGQFEQEL